MDRLQFRRTFTRRALLASGATIALPGMVGRAGAQSVGDVRIQRLNWAGVRIQTELGTLFIDPLLDRDAWGDALKEEFVAFGDWKDQPVVLVTHRHPDHTDPKALSAILAKGGTFAFPEGMTAPRSLADTVRERPSRLWEPQLIGAFTATPVPASDGYGDPQVSWVVSVAGRRIFHGGDTLWHGSWWRIGRQYGPFDAAFLPVNGARFGWQKPASSAPAVLTPEQAMDAATILGAKRIVPIHYGVSGAEGYQEVDDPIGRLRRAERSDGPRVQVLRPGEWLDWSRS